ncbi:helix-turn-helix domain-containing protein [Desulfolutivibrio sp.]|uniref:helix-turn-helix domain-containing protein n=1 Tax=Desulfolutivibrio sp. TaxID=2773296 RepID=UPI002F96B333
MNRELTHKDLARRLGVSVTTVKSYRSKFPGVILPVGRGKPLRFPSEALAACRAIHGGFQRGLSIEDIKSVLKKDFPLVEKYERLSISDGMAGPATGGSPSPGREVPATPISPDDAGQDDFQGVAAIRREAQAVAQQDTARRLERLETMLAELVALGSRTHSLHVELLAKLDALAGLPRLSGLSGLSGRGADASRAVAGAGADIPGQPPAVFVALPVVVLSERGEYLGITGADGAAFSLGEFKAHLLRRAGRMDAAGEMYAAWTSRGDDWVLTLRGVDRRIGGAGLEHAGGQETGHEHSFRAAITPKNNRVAVFQGLRINGKDVSEAFLRAFFKQIKDSLE